MATWNQSISPGGLLAGIGTNNGNAPQASDVNGLVSLIRDNNERQRSGQDNLGLQALQGAAGVLSGMRQQQQAQAAKDFQKAYGQAYASGDRNAMKQLATQYPDQIKSIQSGMKFIDDEHRASVGNLAAGARLASTSPDSMASWLQNNTPALQQAGINPVDVANTFQQNPQGFSEFADHLGMAALGPEQYFQAQDRIVGRGIDQNKLQETIRSNQAGEALQSRGQDIQVRGQNISAQNSALDRQIRMAELQDKGLDRQIARETNIARLSELQQKQADAQQKAADARQLKIQTAQQTYDTFNTALGTIAELKSSPGLSKSVGLASAFPTVPGSDAANFEAQLETFKAQTFLPMVQSMKGMGALSDAEGKKLTDAVGALSTKMSEPEFNRSLNRIEGQLRSKLDTAQRAFGVPMQAAQPATQKIQAPAAQGGGYSNLWGD